MSATASVANHPTCCLCAMKTLLLITAALAGFSSTADADGTWCDCSLMVNYETSIIMVYQFPEIDIANCDDDIDCERKCKDLISDNTNNIDLWALDEHGHTVGFHVCDFLYNNGHIPFIFNKIVHGYSRACGGPWRYTEQDSTDMLCCDMGVHDHCTGRK
ncbi:uncharacterized protein LOC125046593 [Penaeus chinensis]|uniref:uncharacterized protein LOC125046593 n=1 Tax=Penaeus chinensis TaxID=139456 RepID=UPI001FB5CC9B|nr:uncharacterized protein LOC125046593 [Penaeus chinensis]